MKLDFFKKLNVFADFSFENISLNGGVLFLNKMDSKIRLLRKIANSIEDCRVRYKCKYSIFSMIAQRVFALAIGEKNLSDHNKMRFDLLMQTAIGSDKILASPTTLSRFERTIRKKSIFRIFGILVENFVKSYKETPREIILDFDGTECRTYGNQKGAMYNGYFKHKCYFPLYVFCGNHLLVSYIRPGNVTDSKYSWGILCFLVKKIRKYWPNVKIIFRGDSAFCRHKMFNWCEKNNIGYITGIAQNNILKKNAYDIRTKINKFSRKTEKLNKNFYEFEYGANSWSAKRRIILKTESNKTVSTNNFIVTNLSGNPQHLYEKVYCGRCDVENRIKEQKLYLFSNCTSGKDMKTNQFRILLSGIAYTLINAIRQSCLKKTKYAKATCSTIRTNLFKIGAIATRDLKTIKISFFTSYFFSIFIRTVFRKLDMVLES